MDQITPTAKQNTESKANSTCTFDTHYAVRSGWRIGFSDISCFIFPDWIAQRIMFDPFWVNKRIDKDPFWVKHMRPMLVSGSDGLRFLNKATPRPIVTSLFTYIMVALTLAMIHYEGDRVFSTTTLYAFGSFSKTAGWWRLFSSAFIHDGLRHLVPMLLLLNFSGRTIEQVLGRLNFVCVFLTCNAIPSILTGLVDDNFYAMGSSLSVIGLYACALRPLICYRRQIGIFQSVVILAIIILSVFLYVTDAIFPQFALSTSHASGSLGPYEHVLPIVIGLILSLCIIPAAATDVSPRQRHLRSLCVFSACGILLFCGVMYLRSEGFMRETMSDYVNTYWTSATGL